MAVIYPVRHKFVSGKADSADPTLVNASNWNDTLNGLIIITATADKPAGSYAGQVCIDTEGQTIEIYSGAAWVNIFNLTLNDALVPADDTDIIQNLLSQIANRIIAITGKTNWYDAPDTTLALLAPLLGNFTINDALVPADDTDIIANLLSQLGNRIIAITGETNWYDNPDATIATLFGKFHESTGHTHDGTAGNGPPVYTDGIIDGPTGVLSYIVMMGDF